MHKTEDSHIEQEVDIFNGSQNKVAIIILLL